MREIKAHAIRAYLILQDGLYVAEELCITDHLDLSFFDFARGLAFQNCVFQKGISGLGSHHFDSINLTNCTVDSINLTGWSGQVRLHEVVCENIDVSGNNASLYLTMCKGVKYLTLVGAFKTVYTNVAVNKGEIFSFALSNATISDSILFSDCKNLFVNVSNSSLKTVIVERCSLMPPSNSEYFANTSFYLNQSIISDAIHFSDITMEGGEIKFENIKTNRFALSAISNVDLVKLKGCLIDNLILAGINAKISILDDSIFENPVSFSQVKIEYIEAQTSTFKNGVKCFLSKFDDGDREAFRLIKSYYQSTNNTVELLIIRAKELRAHRREVWKIKSYRDYFTLVMNELSNYYGTNWMRGVAFTLIVAIFFFCVYLSTIETLPFQWGWKGAQSFFNASSETSKYFFRFFGITHDLEFMKQFKPSGISYFVDTIARVFIGYGLYQTAAAFRKFGKSE
jgi:hypothetical protein